MKYTSTPIHIPFPTFGFQKFIVFDSNFYFLLRYELQGQKIQNASQMANSDTNKVTKMDMSHGVNEILLGCTTNIQGSTSVA